jgi:hypothetical protein
MAIYVVSGYLSVSVNFSLIQQLVGTTASEQCSFTIPQGRMIHHHEPKEAWPNFSENINVPG